MRRIPESLSGARWAAQTKRLSVSVEEFRQLATSRRRLERSDDEENLGLFDPLSGICYQIERTQMLVVAREPAFAGQDEN